MERRGVAEVYGGVGVCKREKMRGERDRGKGRGKRVYMDVCV